MIEATTTHPTTLVLRHTVNAPQERVYTAWTTPEILRTFIAPEGVKAGVVTADARVGGAYSIEMILEDGPMIVRGTYTELRPYEHIACSWTWDEDDASEMHETQLTIDLIPHGEKTEVVLTQSNLRDETSRDNHVKGWSSILENLGTIS